MRIISASYKNDIPVFGSEAFFAAKCEDSLRGENVTIKHFLYEN